MFLIGVTKSAEKETFEKGLFLWITHADKVPPHIGISLNGNYFSLKVSGKDDVSTKIILKAVKRKNIPTLLVEIRPEVLDLSAFDRLKNSHEAIGEKAQTCLVPILEAFDLKDSEYLLVDFLKFLEEKAYTLAYFGLNLPANFEGIKPYTLKEVTNHLRQLKHVEGN